MHGMCCWNMALASKEGPYGVLCFRLRNARQALNATGSCVRPCCLLQRARHLAFGPCPSLPMLAADGVCCERGSAVYQQGVLVQGQGQWQWQWVPAGGC